MAAAAAAAVVAVGSSVWHTVGAGCTTEWNVRVELQHVAAGLLGTGRNSAGAWLMVKRERGGGGVT